MTDYTELVKALRPARTVSIAWEGLMSDAAAAIEALEAELEKYHELCGVDEIPEVLEILMSV